MEIGAETAAPEMSNLVFRNCDIIRTAYIAMDIQHGDRAAVKDVRFENIRLEVDDVNWTNQIQNGRNDKFSLGPTMSRNCWYWRSSRPVGPAMPNAEQ